MALPSIFVEIGAKIDQFERAMGDVSKQLNAVDRQAQKAFSGFDKIGARLSSIGTGLTLGVTAPLAAIGGVALKVGADFESSSNKIKAFGDVGAKDLEKLQAVAVTLGKDTKFSAQQAAEGMAVLAQAGFKTNEVFAAIGGTLDLAAAGELSVGDAAKIAKDTLGQFGLEAGKAGHVADVLAVAAKEGSGSLSDLATTMNYVGPVAHELGISVEETAAAVLTLDKAGIRGERAGTGLRGVLAGLIDPSKEAKKVISDLGIQLTDSSGKFLGFASITGQFQEALGKLPRDIDRSAALVKIFGREAETAASVLIKNGGPAIEAFTKQLENSDGKAREIAKTLNSGLKGALEELNGSVETAAIALSKSLLPAATDVAKSVQAFVNNAIIPAASAIGEFPKPLQVAVASLVGIAAVTGPVILSMGQFAFAVSSLGPALTSMSGFLGVGAGQVARMGGAIAAATPLFLGIGKAALVAFNEFPGRIPGITTLIGGMGSALSAIPGILSGIGTAAAGGFSGILSSISLVSAAIKAQLITSFAALGATITNISFALSNGLVAALTTAELALLSVVHVAAIGAAAYAGWKLGEWAYYQIPGVKAVSDAVGDLLEKIPGVTAAIGYLSGATAITAESNEKFAASTAKLEAFLKAKGITVERGTKTTEEYSMALNNAARAAGLLSKESGDRSKIEGYKKQIEDAKKEAALYAKAQQELGQGVRLTGEHHRDAAPKVRQLLDIDQLLAEKVRILTSEYQKNIHELAAMELEQSRGGKATTEFADGLEELNRSLAEINQTAKLTPDIPKILLGTAGTGQIKQTLDEIEEGLKKHREDLKLVGISHDDTAAQINAAYERIRDSGKETPLVILRAERAALEATIREHEAAGIAITAVQLKRLEELKVATNAAGADQAKTARKWAQQVSTIVNDLAKDLARGTVNLFKNFFDADGFNRGLEEQSRKLRDELGIRAGDIAEFQQNTAAKIAAVEADYAARLERETGELRSSLADRTADYDKYVGEVAGKLETLRDTESNRLRDELGKLADSLRDKEAAYEEFVGEVAGKEEEIRRSHAESLAARLSDLKQNLADQAESYSDFVADANKDLARIGLDLADNIADATRSANQKAEDENIDFNRDIEDLNEQLLKAQKKGDKEATANIQKELRRRTEDHERAQRRIREDLDNQVNDARVRAERQTQDIRDNLAIRAREHQQYIEHNIADQAKATEENHRSQERQLADLQASLDRRTAELLAFRAKTELDSAGAIAASAARLAQEESDLNASLATRRAALDAYRAEVEGKIAELTEHYKTKQAEEVAALNLEFSNKLKEYDTYRVGVEAKLLELENAHKGPLDRIKDLFKSVFDSAADAILRVASEAVIGKLISKLTHLLTDVFPGLSKAIKDIFDTAGVVVPQIPQIPQQLPPNIDPGNGGKIPVPGAPTTPNPGPGAAGGAAGDSISSIVSAVASVVTAISSVVSNFQFAHMNTALGRIEESARKTEIGVNQGDGMLPTMREFMPFLKLINDFNYQVAAPWMAAIQFWTEEAFRVPVDRIYDLLEAKTNRYLEQIAMGRMMTPSAATAGIGGAVTVVSPVYLDGRLLANGITESNEALGGAI